MQGWADKPLVLGKLRPSKQITRTQVHKWFASLLRDGLRFFVVALPGPSI